MTVFVTGGAGFIGSNFLEYYVGAHPNDRVVCIDALTYAADYAAIEPLVLRGAVAFEKGDITDGARMRELFRKYSPQAVVNFAAESHVDRSIKDSSAFVRTNVEGVRVLLEECRRGGVRFHQVSTDEVYGDLPLAGGEPFTENSVLRPSSPYSATKAAADLLTLSYVRTHGLYATISRCGNNYGKNQHEEKLIPMAVKRAVRGEKIPVYGNGENVRDWIAAVDHCRAVDSILQKGRSGEIYNVGAENERSNLFLVQTLVAIVGKGEIEFVKDRKGHDLRYALCADKIKRELGFTPSVPFEEGFYKTVKWYAAKFTEQFS